MREYKENDIENILQRYYYFTDFESVYTELPLKLLLAEKEKSKKDDYKTESENIKKWASKTAQIYEPFSRKLDFQNGPNNRLKI